MSSEARSCSDCGGNITAKSVTGRCKPCSAKVNLRHPNRLVRHKEAMNRPEVRARTSAIAKQWKAERASDPAWQEYQRARAAHMRAVTAERYDLAEMNRQKARRWTVSRLGWCPEHRWPEYRRLRRKIGAAAARTAIEADIAEHARRQVTARMRAAQVSHAREVEQRY